MQEKGLDELGRAVAAFAEARDWGQFHSPKNLAMALIVECAELVEHFQWESEQASYQFAGKKAKKAEIESELADILIYLIRISQALRVDLVHAGFRKLAVNRKRYPVRLARGNAKKYSEHRRRKVGR